MRTDHLTCETFECPPNTFFHYRGESTDECEPMPIKVSRYPIPDLMNRISNVRLKRKEDVFPYQRMVTSSKLVDPVVLRPAQLYALAPNINKLESLRFKFIECFNIDILDITGWLELTYADGSVRAILPPIVETYTGQRAYEEFSVGHSGFTLICDGLHRCYLALQLCKRIRVLDIANPTPGYYAAPIFGGWKSVQLIDKLEHGTRKKFHRFANHTEYYRDFNSAFPYVGASRTVGRC